MRNAYCVVRDDMTICEICGKSGPQIKYITRSHGTGVNLLVIENVPVTVCPNCGESYLTAETLHEIERIKLHPCVPRAARNDTSVTQAE